MLRTTTAIAAFAFVLAASKPGRADLRAPRLVPRLSLSQDKGVEPTGPDPWTTKKRTLSLQGGMPGGPTGLAGLAFEYAPVKWVVLGAGGGWEPDGGARGAFMPRLRLPLNRWIAVGMGFPLAVGPYTFIHQQDEQCEQAGCSTGFRTTRTWSLAVWGHLEPNVEIRIASNLAMRVYGGHSRLLDSDSDRCVSTLANGCPSTLGESRWYGGVALGYAW